MRISRKAIAQAGFNNKNAGIFSVQIVFIALLIGATFQSITVGIVGFFAMVLALCFPYTAVLMVLGLAVFWARIGFELGTLSSSELTPYSVGILFFVFGFFINFSGFVGAVESAQH